MKKIISLLLVIGLLLPSIVLFASCAGTDKDEDDGNLLKIVDKGETKYTIVRSSNAKETVRNAALALKKAINEKYGVALESNEDYVPRNDPDFVIPEYEILVGKTNREEAAAVTEGLTGDQFVIKAVGKRIVICGADDKMTEYAVGYFIRNFIDSEDADTERLIFTQALDESGLGDYTYCISTGMTYEEMARDIYAKFRKQFVRGNSISDGWFWDHAEMLETFIDAYEATKDPAYLEYVKGFASDFESRHGRSWLWNEYNDDIMWITIAYLRIYLLTGEKSYYSAAKSAYDGVYNRAWSDDLGGGFFWKNDNKTKNACVNGPAAIAACYIYQISKDEKYINQAKATIDWMVANNNLYSNGQVYDSYPLSGDKNKWSSTYNQGTFIGACTLIYQNTNEEKYLGYADDTVKYTVKTMFNNGVVNVEDGDNHDLHGFKGILTRWIYRYAVFKNDRSVLEWLQLNAQTAYSNQNSKGLIWTSWGNKTDDSKTGTECVFGFSTAVALMFNSLQWWETGAEE